MIKTLKMKKSYRSTLEKFAITQSNVLTKKH